ncbi:MAG: hypothetical protein IKM94_00720, partial [Alphaproteobacteria bacterium]|nr:hypothetical protein [Alphaproteobacteria bacterium]
AVDWQFELGSVATTYRPYGQIYTDGEVETIGDSANHTATVATLLGVGDYRDTQNINTGAITRNVGVKVLDGTEDWVASSNAGIWILTTWDRAWPGSAMALFSTHYVGTMELNTSMPANSIKITSYASASSRGSMFIKTNYTNLADFKTFLASQYANGTPVVIVYPLATPTTESVAGQTMTTAPVNNRTGGVTGMTITTLLSSGASVVTTIAADAIKIATTAYNSARFSPVVTELNDTIATIRLVVTNTINQTKAIADLQATKQTRPDETCPAGKKCLLVEDNDGQPHWYEIIESASRLPSGYTELQYIQSTGTQYIDTGVSGNISFVVVAQSTNENTSRTSQVLLASSTTAVAGQWFGVSPYHDGHKWGAGTNQTGTIVSINGTTKVTAFVIANNSGISGEINGENFERTANVNHSNWTLFDYPNNSYPFYGKLYSLKITQNNTLVRDFVPAKNSSGVIGMYDTVNDVFYTNQGTGTFVEGPEI